MADFNVTTVQGLIDAINSANASGGPHTIYLGGATFTFSSAYIENPHPLAINNNALPIIRSDITFEGQGSTFTRLPEAPDFRFLMIEGSDLIVNDLTFNDGKVNSNPIWGPTYGGGAICFDYRDSLGNVSINRCTFNNNYAVSGGAIFLWTYGYIPQTIININECVFENNVADDEGGALFTQSTGIVEIEGCQFLNNKAFHTVSRGVNGGGAVKLSAGFIGQAYLNNCDFADNYSSTAAAGIFMANGAAQIRSCNFTNNISPKASAIGGSNLACDVQNCNFNGNSGLALEYLYNQVIMIFAPNNYWGSPDGPSGTGSGSGDGVDETIIYQPFLGTSAPVEHQGTDSCFGAGNDSLTAGNPISLRTGEKREHATDLNLQTKMGSLTFSRSYRQSTQTARDFMGRGWSHNHHMRLSEDTGLKKITVDRPDGTTIFYDDNSDDIFEGAAGATATIVKDTNGYTLSLPDESQYVFNTAGEIISHTMRDGQT
ncbi:MAG: DUF6531 domain-containing protein, partial [Chloroflexota bacterium]